MGNQLTELYLALLDFVEPLRRRLTGPEALEYLFYRYGWNAAMDDAAFARIQQVAGVITPLNNFIQVAEPLRQQLEANPDAQLGAADALALTQAAVSLIRALAEFKLSDLSGLADPFGRADFWEDVAEHIFDDLLEEYLRIYHRQFFAVLRLWNVIRYDMTTPSGPARTTYTRTTFDWAQALAMVETPLEALQHAYHWGDATHAFEHQAALDALQQMLGAIGVPAKRFAPKMRSKAPFPSETGRAIRDDLSALRAIVLDNYSSIDRILYKLGFEIFPAARTGEPQPTGLMIRPILLGGVDKTLPLNNWLTFRFSVSAGLGEAIGVALFPADAGIVGGAPALGASVELGTSGTGPWYLLGNAHSSRVEISGFDGKISLEGTIGDPEIKMRLAAVAANGQPGCRVFIPLGDADEFVKKAVNQSAIDFSFGPEIIWSSKSGLTFNGNPKIDIKLPLAINVGPVTLTEASVALRSGQQVPTGSGLGLQVGVSLVGRLGPVTFVVDQMGFVCNVVPYKRTDVLALPAGSKPPAFGGLDVDLEFAPPSGLGISVDATAVSGGGFLGHVGDEYSGALDLTLADIAVKAYGIVQTKLPGGVPGYSFIVALSTEFSPSIQLPFGFSLDGVGGILGINRTISVDAVQSALWAHHLDGLLFPKDPIASAPQLIAALDSYFPAAPGRYLIGPMAKIGWGDGIVEGEIALLLELPEPLKLLLLGEIEVRVPMEMPQLELHISFDGGIDFGKKLAFFDATLHDSRIDTFPITGDLAFRDNWVEDGSFALALGGFNPHFQPPAAFPALKRLAISISSSVAQIEAQGYIALTTNTLQFGARAEVTAGTGSFNVHGWLGIDALCERRPMSFVFDLSAGIDLRHGTDILASVHLDGQLSGPTPWHISGNASLSLFLFDVTVHFDKTWGGSGGVLSLLDPLSVLLGALANESSFRSVLPAGLRTIVSIAKSSGDANQPVLLEPVGSLRIVQRVLPLGQPITRLGGAPLGRTLQFSMDNVTAFTTTFQTPPTTPEEFAPAQYFEFSDAQKLSLPSFSRFDAGVEIGGDAVDIGSGTPSHAVVTPFTYDTTIYDTVKGPLPGLPYVLGIEAVLAMNGRVTASRPGLGRYAPPVGTPSRVILAPDRWVIAGANDLKLHPDIDTDGSKLGAQLALDRFLAANADQRGQLQVVMFEEAA